MKNYQRITIHQYPGLFQVTLKFFLILLLAIPASSAARNRDFESFHKTWQQEKKQQQEKTEKIFGAVWSSVKIRQKQLEDEARENDQFFFGQKITNPEVTQRVENLRTVLLKIVDDWSRSGKESILALETKHINRVLNESTAVAYYYGADVVKLTKLYELGKDVIRNSYFELADSTNPDDDYSYEHMKNKAAESAREAFTPTILRLLFDDMFSEAEKREIEIAEFMAKKQEYRLLLFKRVTLAYIRALLATGDTPLPCNVKSRKVRLQRVDGKDFPVIGCPDPAIEHLRKYINAIRTLQSAESDNFLAHAQMVIAQQQLIVDGINMIPIVGDAIDWYGLAYGLYAHEDFTGHCMSYVDYGFQFMAAVLPIVTPKILKGWVSRNPDGAVARFLVNMAELTEIINITDARNVLVGSGAGTIELAGMALEKVSSKSDLLTDFAKRWGVSGEDLQRFSKNILSWLDEVEAAESKAITKAAKEASERAVKNAETIFMTDTFQAAATDIARLQKIKQQAPEYFERALKESEEILKLNLLSYQPTDPIKQAGLVPEHGEAIMEYIKQVKAGLADGMDAEEIALIYRAVNPKSAELIGEFGFHTKGMDIKGKSADWGAHDGFIPVDQNFSKLGNPNKMVAGKLSTEDAKKVTKFHDKVKKFLKDKGDEANLFQVALEIEGMPVKVVKDIKSGREITVFFDPGTGRYLDENRKLITSSLIDTSDERALFVLAYPDKNGKPRALTADYDLLAFGFSKDLQKPSFNPDTGFIAPKEARVVDGTNGIIQKMTGYDGKVSHHGAEYYNPYTPGALEEDKLVLAIDLKHGPIAIKRCDQACMIQWCKSSNRCTKFGFPSVPVCDMKTPVPPCIAVDVNRLLKDYMHNMRLNNVSFFPNKKWGWGEWNPLGGWNMVSFIKGDIPPSYYQQVAQHLKSTAEQSASALQRRAFSSFLGAIQPALECPDGKRASDYIEAEIQ